MNYVQINNKTYKAYIEGRVYDSDWNNRSTKTIKLSATYNEVYENFINNAKWSIITEYNDNTVEYDNSDYCLAGPITDNRDGTISVKMGKMTEAELIQKELEETLAIMYAGV